MKQPQVEIDRTGQVIRAELDEHWSDKRLYPSVADTRGHWGVRMAPLFALATKAKAFDDRLMAAVERRAHGTLYPLLARLRAAVAPSRGRTLLEAAAHLAGELDAIDDRARNVIDGFLADPKASRPVGIYTQAEDLSRIFRHDRLLQTDLRGEAGPVREALLAAPDLAAAYRAHLELIAGLSNPLEISGVDRAAPSSAILPASRTIEGDMMKAVFGDRPIPEGFDLGGELIARIRDGRIDTTPRPQDGWYGRQFHAIAALLAPETRGLEIGPLYRDELAQAWRALFTLNRETHVKQLAMVPAGAGLPRLVVRPELTVEPLPEYYERLSAAYHFIGRHLERLGDAELPELIDGIDQMGRLFAGAGAVSRDELGQAASGRDATMAEFRAWLAQIESDPDLATDIRVAVPVYFDVQRKKVRICATVGIEKQRLLVHFARPPAVRVLGGDAGIRPTFNQNAYDILGAVTIECDVDAPPPRETLRAICDEHGEPAAIKAALERL